MTKFWGIAILSLLLRGLVVETAKLDEMSGAPDILSGFLLYLLEGGNLWEKS